MGVTSKAVRTWGLALAMVVLLAGCAETQFLISTAKRVARTGDDGAPQSHYKIGNPYQIDGIWYYPAEDYSYDETGIASWYGAAFHGKRTANGGVYDMNALTAAHRTLPLPSFVRVTNLENGRSLVLEVNDRGPFAKGRIIDISRRGAQLLGFQNQGTARVRVQILADRSRAVASRMSNREELARVGSPITSSGLPKASVSAEALPVPTGGIEAAPQVNAQPVLASNAPIVLSNPADASALNTTSPGDLADASVDQNPTVTQEPVVATNIFVQAGAFGVFENANKVRARLSPLGNVFLDRVLVNERDLFRVRVGPLADVTSADTMLSQVVATGYPDARIIVD